MICVPPDRTGRAPILAVSSVLTHGGLLPTWHPKGSARRRATPPPVCDCRPGCLRGSARLRRACRPDAARGVQRQPEFLLEYEVMVQPRLVVGGQCDHERPLQAATRHRFLRPVPIGGNAESALRVHGSVLRNGAVPHGFEQPSYFEAMETRLAGWGGGIRTSASGNVPIEPTAIVRSCAGLPAARARSALSLNGTTVVKPSNPSAPASRSGLQRLAC
jgi:hypothetical protein